MRRAAFVAVSTKIPVQSSALWNIGKGLPHWVNIKDRSASGEYASSFYSVAGGTAKL